MKDIEEKAIENVLESDALTALLYQFFYRQTSPDTLAVDLQALVQSEIEALLNYDRVDAVKDAECDQAWSEMKELG